MKHSNHRSLYYKYIVLTKSFQVFLGKYPALGHQVYHSQKKRRAPAGARLARLVGLRQAIW